MRALVPPNPPVSFLRAIDETSGLRTRQDIHPFEIRDRATARRSQKDHLIRPSGPRRKMRTRHVAVPGSRQVGLEKAALETRKGFAETKSWSVGLRSRHTSNSKGDLKVLSVGLKFDRTVTINLRDPKWACMKHTNGRPGLRPVTNDPSIAGQPFAEIEVRTGPPPPQPVLPHAPARFAGVRNTVHPNQSTFRGITIFSPRKFTFGRRRHSHHDAVSNANRSERRFVWKC